MNVCEECSYPCKVLHRCKWELFHKRWILICGNCGKNIKKVYYKTFEYGGNANFPVGFFNIKKIRRDIRLV